MEDRSALFNQLKNFSQRGLKKVETKVVTASGEQLVEKRGAKGLQVLSGDGKASGNQGDSVEPARKLDLQVGLILPGFLLASQDVAHDKSSLDSYGITHILNVAPEIENKFEDDYNYKNVKILDKPEFDLSSVLDDCFDFIDDGRHYGNVLIHCSGTIGLSRSTSICVAYLMSKENQAYLEALNNVKEVRSFVKPSESFAKQLQEFEVKLRGAQKVKESGIDDPFALRKKQEIEQEKAMVAGAASVKNRMKMFGATLDTSAGGPQNNRSKSVSPAPMSMSKQPQQPAAPSSKWSERQKTVPSTTPEPGRPGNSTSKSMTPEPRSWSSTKAASNQSGARLPPPPPPPMPAAVGLHDCEQLARSSPLPPPPPPPLPGDLMSNASGTQAKSSKSDNSQFSSPPQAPQDSSKRMVFGRVPPPAMKIKGGLSIEKQDSISEKNMGFNKSSLSSSSKSSPTTLHLPLKRQPTADTGGELEPSAGPERAPSPSATLRAAKQQVAASMQPDRAAGGPTSGHTAGDHRPSVCGQLNRSSTKKLLNLIKTKTKSDLTLPDGDENDEIEALLGALENESIENIDWDELGLDEDEVKEIIEKGAGNLSGSSGGSSSSSSSDDEDEDSGEEVETTTQHFVIRTK